MRRVGITGVGAVTPFGCGIGHLDRALREGRSALAEAKTFSVEGLRASKVGEIGDAILAETPFDANNQRCLGLAVLAANEALDEAGIQDLRSRRTCLALGTVGEARAAEELMMSATQETALHQMQVRPPAISIAAELVESLDLRARWFTFVNACAAGSNAIATCFDRIRLGESDVGVAGGVEILSRPMQAGFNSLHALAPNRCRPFDINREGTQLGEAAAFVVLESMAQARDRGRAVIAELTGYGMSADAFHPTRSDPEGLGPQVAMREALRDANLEPEMVDYVNAHGTATFLNDLIELKAIQAVFGERSRNIPISASKSQLGHTAHACGALECVVSILALKGQYLPPTLNLETPLAGFEGFDFVRDPGRCAKLRHVMTNSFAFGGFNISLILSQSGDLQ